MRRFDEFVDVRSGRIGEGIAGLDAQQLAMWPEGPSQFVWRNRLWRVLGVQARWVESGPWWDSGAVRAARGDETSPGVAPRDPSTGDPHGVVGDPSPVLTARAGERDDTGLRGAAWDDLEDDLLAGDDLLCEQEVWRVEAANGRDGGRGVYELAHAWADGSWRLRAVLD